MNNLVLELPAELIIHYQEEVVILMLKLLRLDIVALQETAHPLLLDIVVHQEEAHIPQLNQPREIVLPRQEQQETLAVPLIQILPLEIVERKLTTREIQHIEALHR